MKARTDCAKCRERIYKEAEEQYLKQEYKFFEDAAYSMAIFATVAALSVHHRRERSRTYIRSFFDEMCLVFDAPPIKGKPITMTDMMKLFEDKYGIDFSKIKLHIESEKEFIHGVQKGKKKS